MNHPSNRSRTFAVATLFVLAATARAQVPETVIVTARRLEQDPAVVADARSRLSRTPGAVSVVASETFEQHLAQGFGDLLRDVPGVLVQKRYGEESRLAIRGSGIGQSWHQRGVLFAQDGVPFADADGFSDFQKIDPLNARYIEVYKGGNALRFGGAQLGGAINLVTPTGRTAQSENAVRIEGGSFDTLRVQGALARTTDVWDVFATFSGLRSDGWREHSRQDQGRGTLNVGRAFGEDREVRLLAYAADINQQVPGTLTLQGALDTPEQGGNGVIANRWARDQDVARVTLQTRWALTESLRFEGSLYTTRTRLHHPISIVIDQHSRTQGLFGRFDWSGTVAGRTADLYWGLSFRDGSVDQQLSSNVNGNPGFRFGDARQDANGLDVFAEGRWFMTDRLAWVLGGSWGRAERHYTHHLNGANDADRTFEWFAPRFGLLWQGDSDAQVYANVTRSVEPPHFGALVQSPYPGFVPLEPQKAWTAELGSRGVLGAFTWDITLYRSRIEDELLTFNNAYGLPSAFANADVSIHQGVEAALDWRLAGIPGGRVLLLRQTYTYSDFAFDGDPAYGNNRLPVIPEHQYRAELRIDFANGAFIAPAVEWRITDTWVDFANTLAAPGYTVWSLGAGWRFGQRLNVFLDLRNLADRRYTAEFGAITNATVPGANTTVFYPGEGRAWFGGMAWRF